MADVRFWNVALTSPQINDLKSKLLTPQQAQKGLVAYFPLNETQAADYKDIISS